jgi:hypothetical protein
MPLVHEIITSLIEKKGGNKSFIARKLGIVGKKKITSQQIGHYASGKYKPKGGFYKRWREVFNEDIESMIEGNVSHETNVQRKPSTGTDSEQRIFQGENIILPKVAWIELQETLVVGRGALADIIKNNTDLTQNNTKLTESITELVRNLLRPSGGNQQG